MFMSIFNPGVAWESLITMRVPYKFAWQPEKYGAQDFCPGTVCILIFQSAHWDVSRPG